MKLNLMTSTACAALLCAAAIANAQTSPSNSSAQSGTTNQSSPGSNNQGNNLDTTSKSPRVDPTSAPATAGQDSAHGNDMVSPNGTANNGAMKQANASHPDFSTLDTKNKGSLSAADVSSNAWLKKNFSKCDTDHDGTLSRAEYEACH
jgi:hypothetical protein